MRLERLPDTAFAAPYCPGCGYPLELGWTVAGRRAWFCCRPGCRWCDKAVTAVYLGSTDSLGAYRRRLWDLRMKESRGAYWPPKDKRE